MSVKTIFLVLALSVFTPLPGHAQETWTVGLRGGFSAKDVDHEDFQQYELFAAYPLPWSWQSTSGWTLATRLNGAAGALRDDQKSGFIGSLGPAVVLGKAGLPVSLEIGTAPTVLSRSHFNGADLGDKFHFTSHAGIHIQFGEVLDAGYRYQHMSNASLDNTNPGLNMHMFWLGYRF